MRSLASLFIAPSPEKIAAKELQDMRLALFQAERRLLEAQMQVDYYRDMVGFLEEVATAGVEQVVDKRRASEAAAAEQAERAEAAVSHTVPVPPQTAAQPSRIAAGLTTVPIVPSAA
ncbi:hypothetical protein EM868_17590 [Cupriavidus gilardii]|uniref:hypothetical protein n=1 Tax=Cupriavidus gilardii TaxID=82541 RepID=UPI00157266B7|nr:hypothetical protein [Cupriavidus gilardii]MCG5262734.1 hypothetical protein [Cupriavidus gilardii]MDF9431593.1 hypothetical protein [Cupriavidus gilardii]NSX02612.1 hypothetical protein [Cupriavidus gilardii]